MSLKYSMQMNHKRICVYGADAETLAKEMVALWKQPVHLLDFRKRNRPSWPERISEACDRGGIVLLALDSSPDARWFASSLNDLVRGQDWARPYDLKNITLVVCISADQLCDIENHEALETVLQERFISIWPNGHSSPYFPPRFRQAVVLVHGMGEQTAMQSVENLAKAVLPNSEFDPFEGYPIEGEMQLRCLKARVREDVDGPSVIRTPRSTDFFEAYWADKSKGTLRQSLLWLWRLLWRWPPRHPPQVRPLWGVAWLLLVATIVLGAFGSFDLFFAKEAKTAVSAVALVIVTFLLNHYVGGYLGDVALYLGAGPAAFKVREKVLQSTVSLLRRLNDSGEYDRIVVVGHSLGSVVAFEAMRIAWRQHYWNSLVNPTTYQPALNAMEEAAANLHRGAIDIELYQDKQLALWHEMRRHGSKWCISDFVTLGSPLTHAKFLLRKELEPVPRKPVQVTDRIPPAYSMQYGEIPFPFRLLLPEDGLFLMTRWTNLFFPTRFGFFGDLVGGALRPAIGPGILDRAVTVPSIFRRGTPWAHVCYLWGGRRPQRSERYPNAVQALSEALDLNAERLSVPREERNTGFYQPF